MDFFRPFVLLFSGLSSFCAVADIAWPEYNQQCRDDAGPPYEDDEELFGPNGFYHDNQAVFPVLIDGNCAKPLQEACNQRPTHKAAYLEGPIDCGNNGWYCRIVPDPNWPAENLIGDLNFGHCNTTEAFEDAGYDRDGHCHGSDVDGTYYWWIRDHFHRAYNGRLRCCCGWYEDTSETPMYQRRIANRCDFRRLVTEAEDLGDCRDANEDHGLGFDGVGCDPGYESSQLNEPIPENDDICWEIQKFGYADENGEDGGFLPDSLDSCFSGDTEVVVRGKGKVAMKKLRVGDFVKIGDSEAYERVYAFGHYVPLKHTEFVQLHTSLGTPPLEMTGGHLVFVEGKTNPVRADSIKVGDLLRAQEDNTAVVQKIELVHRTGIYNPLTSSGTIQVNGITASTYISFQKENNEYAEFRGGIEVVSHHDAAHIAMTPYRFYCTTLAVCNINDANSFMPFYVSMGIELIQWSKQQHVLVQLFVYASFRMILLASISMAFAVLMIPASLLSGSSLFQMQRVISHTSTIGVGLNMGLKTKKGN